MPGGIIQLISRGIEDIHLSHNPQITFFKSIYKKHTNFAIEQVNQSFNAIPNFGDRLSCTLSKNGDLLYKCYVAIELPEIKSDGFHKFSWVNKIGYYIINNIEIEIGGEVIDKHYNDWLYISNEISCNDISRLDKMIGNIDSLIKPSFSKPSYKLYIPLCFWFNKNSGSSLPLFLIHYQSVKFNIEFNLLNECLIVSPNSSIIIDDPFVLFSPNEIIYQTINNVTVYAKFFSYDPITKTLYYDIINGYFQSPPSISSVTLYIITGTISLYFCTPKINSVHKDISYVPSISLSNASILASYIYIDTDERKLFSNSSHEYLIHQLQYDIDRNISSNSIKVRLNFINPCKELFIRCKLDTLRGFNFSDGVDNLGLINNNTQNGLIKHISLLFNSELYNNISDSSFFSYVQPYQHHVNTLPIGVYSYSFSLTPEDYNQPSGSINFSKIDNISIDIIFNKNISITNTAKLRIYCLSHNILHIKNGLAKLLF